VLCSFADEIIENLDTGFSGLCVDGGQVERAESLTHELAAFVIAFSGTEAQACFCRIPKKSHANMPFLVVALRG
jgi:hypothetical protein